MFMGLLELPSEGSELWLPGLSSGFHRNQFAGGGGWDGAQRGVRDVRCDRFFLRSMYGYKLRSRCRGSLEPLQQTELYELFNLRIYNPL